MVPMVVLGVHLVSDTDTPVVLLREADAVTRVLPIFIGPAEAQAIAFGLADITPPRPATHDLLLNVMEAGGIALRAVELTGLEGGTFLAELDMDTAAGPRRVQVRPSDGIALAVRTGVPITAEDSVVEQAAVVLATAEEHLSEDEIEQTVAEFHDFIESADPKAFGDPDDEGA